MKKKSMVIDLDRCTGCLSCELACKTENNIDPGIAYNKVMVMGPVGTFPELKMYFLPALCQSCKDAPCVSVCPTESSYVNDDGVILIDGERCTGCLSCQDACPYGARSFNRKAEVVEKCTLCSHLTAGDKPACVKACRSKARVAGDIEDPASEVSRLLESAGIAVVHSMPDAGNKPTVRYILSKKTAEWQDRKSWRFFPAG